jgi:MerR family transcriptional regulator, light-induced transcriptional regulator
MGRLQQLLRANSSAFGMSSIGENPQSDKRILLLPCPGEQHTFGLSLVAEFFYRAGWDVSTSFVQPTGSLSALVEREWFDVVGLSLGHTAQAGRLDDCVRQIRRASMNPRVLVLAGGVAFALDPELAGQVSADAVINDAASGPAGGRRSSEPDERSALTKPRPRPLPPGPQPDTSFAHGH